MSFDSESMVAFVDIRRSISAMVRMLRFRSLDGLFRLMILLIKSLHSLSSFFERIRYLHLPVGQVDIEILRLLILFIYYAINVSFAVVAPMTNCRRDSDLTNFR